MSNITQSWIEIDAAALRQNVRALGQLVGKSRLAPVIKANAYGHGIEPVIEILLRESLEWIVTNYVYEGKVLRDAGYKGRIFVAGPTFTKEISEALHTHSEIIIGDFATLDSWLSLKERPKVHIKIDTGMSRQGFLIPELPKALAKLLPVKDLVVGICSHFANVEDVLEHDYARLQMERLQQARDIFAKSGFQKTIVHISSSASTLLIKESHLDLCRVGISLYGFWPSPATRLSYLQANKSLPDLKRVLTWKTMVALTKPVTKNDYVGYGCTYKALKDMTIAVLPVGYFEGYPRLAGSGQAYVLIKQTRCPIIGRICMNMMMVDISHLGQVNKGDVVTLIGVDGDEVIDAGDIGEWAQTIHYEIVTRLNPELERRIVNDQ